MSFTLSVMVLSLSCCIVFSDSTLLTDGIGGCIDKLRSHDIAFSIFACSLEKS